MMANIDDKIQYYKKQNIMSYHEAEHIIQQCKKNPYSHYYISDKDYKTAQQVLGLI